MEKSPKHIDRRTDTIHAITSSEVTNWEMGIRSLSELQAAGDLIRRTREGLERELGFNNDSADDDYSI